MTETDYDIKAAAFAKELKDLMKKHGVEHLYGSAYNERYIMISLAAGEHYNGEIFTMSYRLGNIHNLHAAEVSELSNTFNEH
jgi:hypothetical protein